MPYLILKGGAPVAVANTAETARVHARRIGRATPNFHYFTPTGKLMTFLHRFTGIEIRPVEMVS